MNNFSALKKESFFEIVVSEKIKDKNLKNFLLSSFKINNINLENKDRVFTTFVEELKEYQVFILKENYKYFEFQVFEVFYQNNEKKGFDLYLCEDFFCLYKNGLFYYFQNFTLNLPLEEFIEYLNKKFQIKIENYEKIDKSYLNDLKKSYLNDKIKTSLKTVNLKNDYSFYLFLFYIFILITFLLVIFLGKNDSDKMILENKNQIKELKNSDKFKSFYEKMDLIFQKIKINNLELITYEFKENSSKIVLNSNSKDKIYTFLENNKKELISSSINFIENKNLYEVVLYVRIF